MGKDDFDDGYNQTQRSTWARKANREGQRETARMRPKDAGYDEAVSQNRRANNVLNSAQTQSENEGRKAYTPGKTFQDDYYQHTMTGRALRGAIKKITGK